MAGSARFGEVCDVDRLRGERCGFVEPAAAEARPCRRGGDDAACRDRPFSVSRTSGTYCSPERSSRRSAAIPMVARPSLQHELAERLRARPCAFGMQACGGVIAHVRRRSVARTGTHARPPPSRYAPTAPTPPPPVPRQRALPCHGGSARREPAPRYARQRARLAALVAVRRRERQRPLPLPPSSVVLRKKFVAERNGCGILLALPHGDADDAPSGRFRCTSADADERRPETNRSWYRRHRAARPTPAPLQKLMVLGAVVVPAHRCCRGRRARSLSWIECGECRVDVGKAAGIAMLQYAIPILALSAARAEALSPWRARARSSPRRAASCRELRGCSHGSLIRWSSSCSSASAASRACSRYFRASSCQHTLGRAARRE